VSDVHPLVDRIIDEQTGRAPDVVMFWGFPARSSRDAHTTRLYLNFRLSAWLDIDDTDIVHSETPPQDQVLTSSALWVKRGASIEYGAEPLVRGAADFLRGGIVEGHLRNAAAEIWCRPEYFSARTTPAPPRAGGGAES
jgi:hypothetical protein